MTTQEKPATTEDITPEQAKLEQEIGLQLDNLFKTIWNTDTPTEEEKQLAVQMDMHTKLNKINVSVAETRQPANYSSNNYFASAEIDFTGIWDVAAEMLKKSAVKDKVLKFYKFKRAFTKHVQSRYAATEQHLRGLLRIAQEKDNIPAMGRFAQSGKTPK